MDVTVAIASALVLLLFRFLLAAAKREKTLSAEVTDLRYFLTESVMSPQISHNFTRDTQLLNFFHGFTNKSDGWCPNLTPASRIALLDTLRSYHSQYWAAYRDLPDFPRHVTLELKDNVSVLIRRNAVTS